MKHLISIEDITAEEITQLLDQADEFRNALQGREIQKVPTLRGRKVASLFYENSTRTKSSFDSAAKALSADVLSISASSSSVKKGESLRDTGLTLKAIGVEAFIMRHPSSGAPKLLADWVAPNGEGPSVINAGDGSHQHPTQALLDAVTFRQHLGGFKDKSIAIVGDLLHSRVVRSNVDLLSKMGAKVYLVAPPTLMPAGVETWPAEISYDLDPIIKDLDAVMLLRVQQERMLGGFFPSDREYTARYGLTSERLAKMQKHALVMHPGPMIRGNEIEYAVADSSHSVVLKQVSNGVYLRMAVLFTLLSGKDEL
ncbi:aspartate carbamoyltransferase catalytic subunit [Corynebacterium pyruviciproducens]|uniref:Aspartate carbamoyltransferase n=2 Tax=Corynebacterium pyruviciproducens TaxID=598660 RepID=S2ZXF0_9CORY|nr:aspartate carbamoyltransferase catalytic subunit [Corynebacterium pyruviciproducens]EPD68689.1 aspartate carbamoyltransferase [Corynebacterium pyruviciproducens ATCC BAA-1742]MDK6565534.1 aspartate carbamoyltransferase catalytic subunit [Corynebacterium pyruviciproducens]MDK7215444.1 aspartate carbamoyltransferase catalytic subunit [Corynebacterium pyruviciproducens]WOT02033.1 aspartate carbamoyltransferase catalytic subunit [Corynebacterium pyruviciproducens]